MKTLRSLLCFTVLFISSVLLHAQEIDLTDFRIRESRYQRWELNGNGGVDVNSNSSSTNSNWSDNSRIALGSVYKLSYHSEQEFYRLNAELNSSFNKSFHGSNFFGDTTRSANRSEYLNIITSGTYGSYIVPDRWYWHAGYQGMWEHELSRNDYRSTTSPRSLTFSKHTNDYGWITGGIGYGKVRDARSVIAIVRILEDLSEAGVLVRTLNNDEVIAMAEQYDAELNRVNQYDRRTKYLIGYIIGDLMEKGLINVERTIGYVSGRAIEVFSEQIYSRATGWQVQTGPVIAYQERRNRYTNGSQYFKMPDHRWRISAEYGIPLTLQMHFSSTVVVDLPVLPWQKQLESSIISRLTHEIGERSSAQISLQWEKSESINDINYPGESHYNNHYLTLYTQYNYLLEDNIMFSVGMAYSDNRGIREQPMGRSRTVGNTGSVFFNLNYRLL